jgi:branched-chain amino acid transport system permease protein
MQRRWPQLFLRLVVVGGVLALLLVLNAVVASGRFMDDYVVRVLLLCGINITMAVSLNLINGFTGQFSIGHAGFMAVGAYCGAALSVKAGPRLVTALGLGRESPAADFAVLGVAVLVGGIAAAIVGLLVGIPSLRLRGDYLAIVTLGFGEIIRVVLLNVQAVGGAGGLTGIPPLTNFFWVALAAVAVVALSRNLMASTYGLGFLAVREDEIAAEAMGINTTKYKVVAFVVGAFFAGVGGVLYAHQIRFIQPSNFSFILSIQFIVMVVLGGMGSITGSVVAAIILTVLPEALRGVEQYRLVTYSLLLILLMLTRPQGLFGRSELSWARVFPRRRELIEGNVP